MKHLTAVSKVRPIASRVERPAFADSGLIIKESRIANWAAFVAAASDTLSFITELLTFGGGDE